MLVLVVYVYMHCSCSLNLINSTSVFFRSPSFSFYQTDKSTDNISLHCRWHLFVSIKISEANPVHVQKTIYPDKYDFKLIDSDDSANGNLLHRVEIVRSADVCFYQKIYFDQDRILSVKEKPGTYVNYLECPESLDDTEVVYEGYRIEASQFVTIDDQDDLIDLYKLIQLNMVCITDLNNLQGRLLFFLPDDVEDISCYSFSEYRNLQDSTVFPDD